MIYVYKYKTILIFCKRFYDNDLFIKLISRNIFFPIYSAIILKFHSTYTNF